MYGCETAIIGVYALTNDATQQTKDEFYEDFSHTLDEKATKTLY